MQIVFQVIYRLLILDAILPLMVCLWVLKWMIFQWREIILEDIGFGVKIH